MNIWVNGCFDILHTGHIDLLWFAKLYKTNETNELDIFSQNRLIVGLDSDNRIKQYKGNGRPINDAMTRLKIMSNLKMVDNVVIFNNDSELEKYITLFDIDYIIVGEEYRNKRVVGSDFVKIGVDYYPIVNGLSTTNIINKIKTL